jgi:hypothetical protein
MPAHKRASGESLVAFSRTLSERLGNEEIDVAVGAGTVDVPRGHLAVIFTLSSPNSSIEQKLKAERIVIEECIKYLHEEDQKP